MFLKAPATSNSQGYTVIINQLLPARLVQSEEINVVFHVRGTFGYIAGMFN